MNPKKKWATVCSGLLLAVSLVGCSSQSDLPTIPEPSISAEQSSEIHSTLSLEEQKEQYFSFVEQHMNTFDGVIVGYANALMQLKLDMDSYTSVNQTVQDQITNYEKELEALKQVEIPREEGFIEFHEEMIKVMSSIHQTLKDGADSLKNMDDAKMNQIATELTDYQVELQLLTERGERLKQ